MDEKKEFDKIINHFYDSNYTLFLEAEVERLKGMKKEDDGMEYIIVMNTHNQCIDDQITHLTNIIKEIK